MALPSARVSTPSRATPRTDDLRLTRIEHVPQGLVAFTRQHVGGLQELQLASAVAEQRQEGGVGVAQSAIDEQQGALRGGLDQRVVARVRVTQPLHALFAAALDAQRLLQHEQEQQGDDAGDAERGQQQVALETFDLRLHVIDVHARADDPVPGLEALDVGLLRLEPFDVVEPLPDVVDVALLLLLDEVRELHEDLAPRAGR